MCAGAFVCVCVNSIVTFVESQAGWSDQIQIIEAWGITAKVYPQELPTWVQEFSKLGVVQVVVAALQRLEPLPITAYHKAWLGEPIRMVMNFSHLPFNPGCPVTLLETANSLVRFSVI